MQNTSTQKTLGDTAEDQIIFNCLYSQWQTEKLDKKDSHTDQTLFLTSNCTNFPLPNLLKIV